MRWAHPKAGQIIWKKHFALFPKKIQNHTIWLEFYYTCYIYDTNNGWDDRIHEYREHYLVDSPQVQAHLLTLSPLAQLMKEDD